MINSTQQNVRDYLQTVSKEAMKCYRVFDGTGRVIYQYDAPAIAQDGDTCMRTQYAYSGSSFNVVKFCETLQTWSSAWDVTP